MIRSGSMMATWLAGIMVIITAALPAFAGGNHNHRYHDHGYDDDVDCYQVTKVYEHYGRPALFGGTQCRDHYGDTWIVSGSRHLIRYLDEYDDDDYYRLEEVPDDDRYDRW